MNELLVEIDDLDLTVEETITIVENYWLELAENTADPEQKKTFMQKAGQVGSRVLQSIGRGARGIVDNLKKGYAQGSKPSVQAQGSKPSVQAQSSEPSANIDANQIKQFLTKAGLWDRNVELALKRANHEKMERQKNKEKAQAIAKDPSKNPFANQYRREQFELPFKEWLMANPN